MRASASFRRSWVASDGDFGPDGGRRSDQLDRAASGRRRGGARRLACQARLIRPPAWQDPLVAAVGTHSHLMGEHELQKGDQDSGRREAALLAEPVWVPRTATPRQREQREQPASHRSASSSVVVALGVGAKGSRITTLVVTPRGHGRLAPLLIRMVTLVMTPRGHERLAPLLIRMRATPVVTGGPVLRLLRQGVAGHGLERLCVAQR